MAAWPLNQQTEHHVQAECMIARPFQNAFHFATMSVFNCAGFHVRQQLVFILMNATGA